MRIHSKKKNLNNYVNVDKHLLNYVPTYRPTDLPIYVYRYISTYIRTYECIFPYARTVATYRYVRWITQKNSSTLLGVLLLYTYVRPVPCFELLDPTECSTRVKETLAMNTNSTATTYYRTVLILTKFSISALIVLDS